jgi:Amt family ammonium transporter
LVIVVAFAFFGSYVLLKLIGLVTPLRVSVQEEDTGLDTSEHGEEVYAWELAFNTVSLYLLTTLGPMV